MSDSDFSFLFSGIPPLGNLMSNGKWDGYPNFRDTWKENIKKSDEVFICTGYVSNDAVAETRNLIELNPQNLRVNLCVGMAKFDGLSRSQIQSLRELARELKSRDAGGVWITKAFPFHGKVIVFCDSGKPFASTIGSSNFSGISPGAHQYECDVLLRDQDRTEVLLRFSRELIELASVPFDDSVEIRETSEKFRALDNCDGVEVVDLAELRKVEEKLARSRVRYEMPLRAGSDVQKSNLNVFFSGPRQNSNRTFGIPRPWYEIEVQPKREWFRSCPDFPGPQEDFVVVTDDGHSFKVVSSLDRTWNGQKNFRSKDDLQILGRWLKGRLEAAGVLIPGNPILESTLTEYGRSTIGFTKIPNDHRWFMDFSV